MSKSELEPDGSFVLAGTAFMMGVMLVLLIFSISLPSVLKYQRRLGFDTGYEMGHRQGSCEETCWRKSMRYIGSEPNPVSCFCKSPFSEGLITSPYTEPMLEEWIPEEEATQ